MALQNILLQLCPGRVIGSILCTLRIQKRQKCSVVAFGFGPFLGLFVQVSPSLIGQSLRIGLVGGLFNHGAVVGSGFLVFLERFVSFCPAHVGIDVVRVQLDGLGKGCYGFGVVLLGQILPPEFKLLRCFLCAGCAGCKQRQYQQQNSQHPQGAVRSGLVHDDPPF